MHSRLCRPRKPAAKPRDTKAPATRAKTSTRKLTFNEARELAGIEHAIATAEAKVTELETAIADPAVFSDYTRAGMVTTELEAAKREVERLFARWQELDAIATGDH